MLRHQSVGQESESGQIPDYDFFTSLKHCNVNALSQKSNIQYEGRGSKIFRIKYKSTLIENRSHSEVLS